MASKMSILKTIIALGLAAGAALYVHSTYITANRQNQVPAPVAAGSKIWRDMKSFGQTGKDLAERVSEFAYDVDDYSRRSDADESAQPYGTAAGQVRSPGK
jgi:hypothetical protein